MSAQPPYRHSSNGELTAKGVVVRGLAAVIGVGVLVAWAVTQHAALRLGFHPSLGRPWLPALLGREELLNLVAWALWGAALLLLVPKRTRLLSPIVAVLGAGAFAWSLGPLFTPFHVVVWARRLGATAEAREFWRSGFQVLGVATGAAAAVAAIVGGDVILLLRP